MSPFSKGLVAVAVALAGSQAKSLISRIDLDQLLKPIGLARRRTHWGSTMAVLGAGIVVGGSAVLLFVPSAAASIRERFENSLQAKPAKANKPEPQTDRDAQAYTGADNHRSKGIRATT